MDRLFIHYGIHILLPILVGVLVYPKYRLRAIFILLAGFLIDLDHFWASPIFDPDRCSINFHPLHSYWAIAFYLLLLLPKKTRIWGIGLLIHIVADLADCYLMV